MLTEEIISAVSGPPIGANTAVPKDVGIYSHTLTPSWGIKSTFKKSSTPNNCMAVSNSHIFTAQDQKSHVHVYSRTRGNQETFVSFQERIRSVALAGDVLILGTAEGRLILWETCTGRQIITPPCHVQAICCLAVTSNHVLTASEDSNINVWSLARLLELGADPGFEPDLTLSNHRSAITSLVAAPGENPETSLCVSSSKDKTCILWNFRNGQVLRTLLFTSIPLCTTLDPCGRSLYVSCEDGSLYMVELFGGKALVGSRSAEVSSLVVQVDSPLGVADAEAGPATCLAVNYDGTLLLTGHTKGKLLRWTLADNSHPTELANLNASITNLTFVPLLKTDDNHTTATVVKPNPNQRQYTIQKQLGNSAQEPSRFDLLMASQGFPAEAIAKAASTVSDGEVVSNNSALAELQRENEELKEIMKEQKELQKATLASR